MNEIKQDKEMGKNYSLNEIIDWSNNIHSNKYTYKEYSGMLIKMEIICPIHGSFWQTPAHHIHRKHGCPKCKKEQASIRNRMSFKTIIARANETHNYLYKYPDQQYINELTKIEIICPIHGSFWQSPSNHIHRKQGCPKCNRGIKSTLSEFIEKSMYKFKNKFDYNKTNYTLASKEIIITCKIHGDFETTPSKHLLASSGGCYDCFTEHLRENLAFTTEEFIEKSKFIFGESLDYSLVNYINNSTAVALICKIHGQFNKIPFLHLSRGSGCPKCRKYNVSKISQIWLDSFKNPNIIQEKRIYIDNKYYIVDGFDPINNTIFEFNGDFWHGNPNIYRENELNKVIGVNFGELYHKTIEKQTQMLKAGYNIITIWERDFRASLYNTKLCLNY